MTDNKTLLPDVIYADIGSQRWSPFSGAPCVKYIRADLAEVQPSPEGKNECDCGCCLLKGDNTPRKKLHPSTVEIPASDQFVDSYNMVPVENKAALDWVDGLAKNAENIGLGKVIVYETIRRALQSPSARVLQLETALKAMLEEYQDVYDMKPKGEKPYQSEEAKYAQDLAIKVLSQQPED